MSKYMFYRLDFISDGEDITSISIRVGNRDRDVTIRKTSVTDTEFIAFYACDGERYVTPRLNQEDVRSLLAEAARGK